MLIETNPEGRKLAPAPVESENEMTGMDFEHVEAAPVVEDASASHGASAPGPTPQARLDTLRKRENGLIAERAGLMNAAKLARAAVADAVRAFQEADPHRVTPEQLSAEFRRASQEQRAARARGETWATPPQARPRGEIAYADAERAYSFSGDGNQFARNQNKTGNRRGAYPRQSLGQVNRDPTRGATPAPVAAPRGAIPALSK